MYALVLNALKSLYYSVFYTFLPFLFLLLLRLHRPKMHGGRIEPFFSIFAKFSSEELPAFVNKQSIVHNIVHRRNRKVKCIV